MYVKVIDRYHYLDSLFENEWLSFADENKIDESESIRSDATYHGVCTYVCMYVCMYVMYVCMLCMYVF